MGSRVRYSDCAMAASARPEQAWVREAQEDPHPRQSRLSFGCTGRRHFVPRFSSSTTRPPPRTSRRSTSWQRCATSTASTEDGRSARGSIASSSTGLSEPAAPSRGRARGSGRAGPWHRGPFGRRRRRARRPHPRAQGRDRASAPPRLHARRDRRAARLASRVPSTRALTAGRAWTRSGSAFRREARPRTRCDPGGDRFGGARMAGRRCRVRRARAVHAAAAAAAVARGDRNGLRRGPRSLRSHEPVGVGLVRWIRRGESASCTLPRH